MTITLYDLAVALDDTSILPRCMLGTAECSDDRACPAHQFWSGIRNRYTDFLRNTTVGDVAAFEAKRKEQRALAMPAGGVIQEMLRVVVGSPERPGAESNRRPAI